MENELMRCTCLHGFIGCPEDWHPLMKPLRGVLDAKALDLEALFEGLPTQAVGFEGMLDALFNPMQEGPDLLMGYSMGGRLALGTALRSPRGLRGLVLISATPGIRGRQEREARVAADRQWAERLACEPLEALLEDWYRQPVFSSLQERPDLLSHLIQGRQGKRGNELARMLDALGTGQQPDFRNDLDRLEVPVLLIAGENDPKFCGLAREMYESMPFSSLSIIPGAGHMPHLECPDAVAAALKSFMLKLPV